MIEQSIKHRPFNPATQLPSLNLNRLKTEKSLLRVMSLERHNRKSIKEHLPKKDKKVSLKPMKCLSNISSSVQLRQKQAPKQDLKSSIIICQTQILRPRQIHKETKSDNNLNSYLKSKLISPNSQILSSIRPTKKTLEPLEKGISKIIKEEVSTNAKEITKKYPPQMQFEFQNLQEQVQLMKQKAELKRKAKRQFYLDNRTKQTNISREQMYPSLLSFDQIFQSQTIQRFDINQQINNELCEYVAKKHQQKPRKLSKPKKSKRKQVQKYFNDFQNGHIHNSKQQIEDN